MKSSALIVVLLTVIAFSSANVAGPNKLSLFNSAAKSVHRTISTTVEIGGHAIDIFANQASNSVRDQIRLFFTTDGFPRWWTRLYAKRSDSVDRLRFRVGFFKIVEFIDDGSRVHFNRSSIVQQWNLIGALNALSWSTIAVNVHPSPDDASVSLTTFSTGVTKQSGTATLTLKFTIPTAQLVTSGNISLSPNALKMDVDISDWQWTGPAGQTKLAIIAGLLTDVSVTKLDSNPQPDSLFAEGAIVVANNNDAHFSWIRSATATVGSTTSTVAVSSFPLWTDAEFGDPDIINSATLEPERQAADLHHGFAFVFETSQQPTALTWDPTTAMTSGALSSTTSSWTAVLFSIVLAYAAMSKSL